MLDNGLVGYSDVEHRHLRNVDRNRRQMLDRAEKLSSSEEGSYCSPVLIRRGVLDGKEMGAVVSSPIIEFRESLEDHSVGQCLNNSS